MKTYNVEVYEVSRVNRLRENPAMLTRRQRRHARIVPESFGALPTMLFVGRTKQYADSDAVEGGSVFRNPPDGETGRSKRLRADTKQWAPVIAAGRAVVDIDAAREAWTAKLAAEERAEEQQAEDRRKQKQLEEAAPDLLAALKQLVGGEVTLYANGKGSAYFTKAQLKAARAAIAKATP